MQGTGVSPARIALGEAVDDRVAEAVFVVENVVRDADALGDGARIVDVLPRAAGALAMGRRAMVVELQRHADDVIALALEERRRHRRIHAARHRHDDAGVLRLAGKIETVQGHATTSGKEGLYLRRGASLCNAEASSRNPRQILPRGSFAGPTGRFPSVTDFTNILNIMTFSDARGLARRLLREVRKPLL